MTYFVLTLNFLLSFFITKKLISVSQNAQLIDIPNHRSSHKYPTPTGGGLAIAISLLISLAICHFLSLHPWPPYIIPSFIIAAVSFIDDRINLSAKLRLFIQLTSAYLACYLATWSATPSFWVITISVLAIVWMTNLYNFMDGIDGISSVQIITVSLFCSFSMHSNSPSISFTYLALALSTSGFFLWNWQPAKIFMGDVGSAFCGFLLGVLGLLSIYENTISIYTLILIHGTFIFDATATLLVRFLRKDPIMQAHRSHTYQKANIKGYTHSQVSLTYLLINLFWLFPLAWLSSEKSALSPWFLLLGLSPLLVCVIYFKSGTPETRE